MARQLARLYPWNTVVGEAVAFFALLTASQGHPGVAAVLLVLACGDLVAFGLLLWLDWHGVAGEIVGSGMPLLPPNPLRPLGIPDSGASEVNRLRRGGLVQAVAGVVLLVAWLFLFLYQR